MKKNTIKYILVLLLTITVCQNTLAKNNNIKQRNTCSFESVSKLLATLPVDVTKKSFDSTKYSTEGAHIDAYFADNLLIKIEVFIYGETSKTQIEYVFKTPADYVVNYTHYYYSSPMYIEGSQIMATRTTEFIVCNGEPQTVVGQADIKDNMDTATQLLKDIKRQLNDLKNDNKNRKK